MLFALNVTVFYLTSRLDKLKVKFDFNEIRNAGLTSKNDGLMIQYVIEGIRMSPRAATGIMDDP